ncbi:MAG TPA: glycosyltransferase [Geminicoccus sp.]|jgi:glycosyltransferase involved in cell wall biosynthesis|uniref:glycosyltransferase n=1 Tax=Geminicoccus sp. TaxID=2024832 RepID=UPI002E2ED0C8|nr:glycosyltransferase [Geminicoccus sp.]HEX2526157.1 glycosyltransferase [Geminicoccus sp.]
MADPGLGGQLNPCRALDPAVAGRTSTAVSSDGRSGNARRTVLHLAVDYPDAFDRQKTVAIRNFVEANRAVDHVVVALTRTEDPRKVVLVHGDGAGDGRVYSMRYLSPPFGILLYPAMAVVAWRIRRLIERERIRVDLIHAHKLCFEGISGYLLARWLDKPLVCSVRAEAESKIVRFMPHYHPLIRRIIRRCERLYYVSLWYRPTIERLFPEAAKRGRPLPNFCPGTALPADARPDPDRFVTILHLDIYKKKGLDRLLEGFARFAARHPEAKLDIIGRGTPQSIGRIEGLIRRVGLEGRARLRGALPRSELLAELPGFGAMCLPSHNETFGMVYVEALLSGVPILYSTGTGIDGFLEEVDGAVGVDPTSVDAITQGLEELRAGHARMRASLIARHAQIAARFEAAPFVERYNRELGLAA